MSKLGVEDKPFELDDKLLGQNFLLALPDVVLFKILSHFSVADLCVIGRVCRKLYDFTHDPVLWKVLDFTGVKISTNCFHRLLQNARLCEDLRISSFKNSYDSKFLIEIPKTCGQTLRKLTISSNRKFNAEVLKHIVTQCIHLQSINFEGCDRLLLAAKVEENANCSDFALSSSVINDLPLYSSCLLAALPHLSSINLSNCAMVQNDELLNLVSHLECLERLNIDGILNVRDNLVVALCERHKSRLTHLFLDGENLTGGCAGALGSCERLRALRISCMVGFNDRALQCFSNLSSLEMLKLGRLSCISSAAFCELFAGKQLKNLRQFVATECELLTNDAIVCLVNCCGAQLQVLVLSWAKEVDDIGLQCIVHGCPNLRRLGLARLLKINGLVLADAPEKLPHLAFLSLVQCIAVDIKVLESLVLARPEIRVVDFHGRKLGNEAAQPVELNEYESF